jgi:hypothetical protein
MKKSFFVMLAAIASLAGNSWGQIVSNLEDIQFWVGSGANESALVINFNDGSSRPSFAWGFRWDGIATGAEMVAAIAAADTNLSILFGGTIESGFFLTSVTYFDGFETHSATSGNFIDDFNYWSYSVVGGTAGGDFGPPEVLDPVVVGPSFAFPAMWESSPVGASADSFGGPGRFLANNSWDAWSFGEFPVSDPTAASTFAAIPEPSSILLLGLGAGLLLLRRKKA